MTYLSHYFEILNNYFEILSTILLKWLMSFHLFLSIINGLPYFSTSTLVFLLFIIWLLCLCVSLESTAANVFLQKKCFWHGFSLTHFTWLIPAPLPVVLPPSRWLYAEGGVSDRWQLQLLPLRCGGEASKERGCEALASCYLPSLSVPLTKHMHKYRCRDAHVHANTDVYLHTHQICMNVCVFMTSAAQIFDYRLYSRDDHK